MPIYDGLTVDPELLRDYGFNADVEYDGKVLPRYLAYHLAAIRHAATQGDASGLAVGAARATGTSTTAESIRTGEVALVTQGDRWFDVGNWVVAYSTATPANRITGPVTAFNRATGRLVINAVITGGSGAVSNWTIRLAGLGAMGATGATGAAAVLVYNAYAANGTWTKSSTAAWVYVEVYGGGGGGGSGAANNTGNTTVGGGGGGGGGGFAWGLFRASDLPASVSITVGAAANGGNSRLNTDPGPGYQGGQGNDSYFGTYIQAYGGSGGQGGVIGSSAVATFGGGGGGGLSAGSLISGGRGGGGPPTCSTTPGDAVDICGGGGGGGHEPTNRTGRTGGNGGYGGGGGGGGGGSEGTTARSGGAGGGTRYSLTGAAPAANGTTSATGAGTGGGGSGATVGGNGGAPGGGGGGGAGLNANNSGAGGQGARGEVRVWQIRS